VGDWYWIGACLGIGVAAGTLLSGLIGVSPAGLLAAILLAALGGAVVGVVVGNWDEALAGGLGGLVGALGTAQLSRGALRTGGTRAGTAVLLALGALLVAAAAFVPVVGYLEAIGAAALGIRLRQRAGKRVAGLRVLARD